MCLSQNNKQRTKRHGLVQSNAASYFGGFEFGSRPRDLLF